jgi:hypothetical protein
MRDYSLYAVENGKLREYASLLADDDDCAFEEARQVLPGFAFVLKHNGRTVARYALDGRRDAIASPGAGWRRILLAAHLASPRDHEFFVGS